MKTDKDCKYGLFEVGASFGDFFGCTKSFTEAIRKAQRLVRENPNRIFMFQLGPAHRESKRGGEPPLTTVDRDGVHRIPR